MELGGVISNPNNARSGRMDSLWPGGAAGLLKNCCAGKCLAVVFALPIKFIVRSGSRLALISRLSLWMSNKLLPNQEVQT